MRREQILNLGNLERTKPYSFSFLEIEAREEDTGNVIGESRARNSQTYLGGFEGTRTGEILTCNVSVESLHSQDISHSLAFHPWIAVAQQKQ